MKKTLLTIAITIAGYYSHAQTNAISSTGNVGIGTTSPIDLMQINAGANRRGMTITSDGDPNAYTDITLSINNTASVLLGAPVDWLISHRKDGYFSNTPLGQSSLEFYANLKGGNYYAPLSFKSDGNVILVSNKNALGGNVGIGTTTPDSKLAVNGTIHSKEVKVDLTGWADYVFKPKYKLASLTEVKTYVDKNQHLPDMPSEQEVAKNGINLGEMNKLLTKKVEELTLYLIEQQNQMKQLKQQLNAITKALNKN